MRTPTKFEPAMGLTFEQANLDFAGDYSTAARDCGDIATAEALEQVHADEIKQVTSVGSGCAGSPARSIRWTRTTRMCDHHSGDVW